jgi:hypothetical protein
LLTHLSLPLYFSLTGGASCFFSPSPSLLTAKAETPGWRRHRPGRRRDSSAPNLLSRLAWRLKVVPSSPFSTSQSSPPAQDLAAPAAAARSQRRPHSCDPRASQPSGPAQAASTSPLERAQASGYAPQRPDPRSPRWRHGTAAHGGAAVFLSKPRHPNPNYKSRSTKSPRITGNTAHPGLIPLLQQGSPEGSAAAHRTKPGDEIRRGELLV